MPKVRKLAPEDVRKTEYVTPPQPTGAMPEPANYVIFLVETMTIKPAPWNPPTRTTRRAVADLIRRMEDVGFEGFRPILLSKDGCIGDGHRRWTAAQYLGLARVPVIYTEKSVEELWAGNAGARQPKTKEWMAAHILGGVDVGNPRTADQVEQLLVILGDEGVRYLIERGQSPDVYRTVWKVGQYCKKTDLTFLRKTTYWLVKHKMIDKTRKAIYAPAEEQIDPRILIQAIENDLPLKSSWGFSS